MIAVHLVRRRRPPAADTGPGPWHHGAPYGVAAGFATTVANAAGPVMSLYLLSRRLPKDDFMATGVWFFFLINLIKLPIYGGLGMLTARSLAFDACLLPAVALGALIGRAAVQRLRQRTFETTMLALTTASALYLCFKR
jgi:uncharacterized membrane protein YfcA